MKAWFYCCALVVCVLMLCADRGLAQDCAGGQCALLGAPIRHATARAVQFNQRAVARWRAANRRTAAAWARAAGRLRAGCRGCG